MHLDIEGMTPEFNKDITEYSMIVPIDVNAIQVNAIPEDQNAIVEIQGNDNLNVGNNVIQIKVSNPNTGENRIYKVNVNKTNDENFINTNLENLAIEGTVLIPEFSRDIVEYRAEIQSDLEKMNILAVPENPKAKVTIEGNENLKYGDNEILIRIVAEDGVTNKTYRLLVYRRTTEDENFEEEEQDRYIEEVKEASTKWWVWFVIAGILIVITILIYFFTRWKLKK